MRYPEFLETITKKATDQGMRVNAYPLSYIVYPPADSPHQKKKQVTYDLLKMDNLTGKNPILLLTAGFHGNEIAGPLTLLYKLEEIITLAKEKDIRLIIFPCINPSGFDIREKYNIGCQHLPEDKRKVNNDFMRYTTKKHAIVSELGVSDVSDGWSFSSDENFTGWLPPETRRMHKLRVELPIKRIKGHLDFHQDCWVEELIQNNPGRIPANGEGTYAYIFDREKYIPIMQKAELIVPALRECFIDTEYKQKTYLKKNGEKDTTTIPDINKKLYSDKNGFICFYDGSISDMTYRLKVPYVAAVETTDATPFEKSMHVYMTWITEFMELMQKK